MGRGSSRTMCSKRRRPAAACHSCRQTVAEIGMLKSAAVGAHGRELLVRLLMCGLVVALLTPPPIAAQAPSPFNDLLSELVTKIASAISSGAPVAFAVVAGDENVEDASAIRTRVTALFASRGIRTADAGAATATAT